MSQKPKNPSPLDLPGFQEDHATVMDRQTERVQPPKMFRVVLLNDDYTPMEFVVETIVKFFNKTREQATQIMLKVHIEGVGVCGVYPQDIAETKMNQVMNHAREAQHPLQCIIEIA